MFIGLLCFVVSIPVGGVFMKWSVHITHTWFPLVPEIPYGTACLATFVAMVGATVMGFLAAGVRRFWD